MKHLIWSAMTGLSALSLFGQLPTPRVQEARPAASGKAAAAKAKPAKAPPAKAPPAKAPPAKAPPAKAPPAKAEPAPAPPAPPAFLEGAQAQKALAKDIFETAEEFAARLAKLPPLRIGTAHVLREAYDLPGKRLPVTWTLEPWAIPLCNRKKGILALDRDAARSLCERSADYPLVARADPGLVLGELSLLTFQGRIPVVKPAVPSGPAQTWRTPLEEPDQLGALPMVDQLVARNVMALGGVEAMNAVRTFRVSSRIENVKDRAQSMSTTTEVNAAGDTWTQMQGPTPLVMGTAAGKTWVVYPASMKMKPYVADNPGARSVAAAAWEGTLARAKARGESLEYLDKEAVDGRDMYRLKLVKRIKGNPDWDVVTIYWMDAATHLLHKSRTTTKGSIIDGKFLQEYKFDDYREVQGLLMAFHSELYDNGVLASHTRIESVAANVEVDPAHFMLPR